MSSTASISQFPITIAVQRMSTEQLRAGEEGAGKRERARYCARLNAWHFAEMETEMEMEMEIEIEMRKDVGKEREERAGREGRVSSDEGRARTERETAERYIDVDVGDRDRCAFILPICRSRSARGASSASMASPLLAFSLPPSFSRSLSLVAGLALNELLNWTMQFRITKRKLFLSEKWHFSMSILPIS